MFINKLEKKERHLRFGSTGRSVYDNQEEDYFLYHIGTTIISGPGWLSSSVLIFTISFCFKPNFCNSVLLTIISYSDGIINLISENNEQSFFNVFNMTYGGVENINFEDFRDFLRRKGIKFFTGKLFKSISPLPFQKIYNF